MSILSYVLVFSLLFGGIGLASYAAAELRVRTLLYGRAYGWMGVLVGPFCMVLSLAAVVVPGAVPEWTLAAAFALLITAFSVMHGLFTRPWAIRKTSGMSDLVRHHTLKSYRNLGFDRAHLTVIIGNHPANPPQLRGGHMSYAKREFVRGLPSPDLHPATEADLRTLVWAAVRSHDDESITFFAPDLSTIFDEVYTDLLWFSGKLTEENIDRIVETAETYGIDAAKSVVDGSMPVEYLTALGIEPLPPRRRLWFEEQSEVV